MAARVLFHSSPVPSRRSGTLVEITRARAGWKYVQFAVRQVAPGKGWAGQTRREECCFVLLRGECRVEFSTHKAPADVAVLGPRRDVFTDYPHALYLPAQTRYRILTDSGAELAEGRAPTSRQLAPRAIRPEDCGLEVRGGGNATRQIIDIMPPAFAADRLLVCEVLTPSGNWSSYPPHKHDADRPPGEVKLEEIYYYRFPHPDAYGVQRLYDRTHDHTLTVRHGDVALIRRGYHPFVTAYGYHAYYLNVLAGTRRSMAASDDPRYAAFRAWPEADPRVPLVARPGRARG